MARYREHAPPAWLGLDAGARGFARHGPHGDCLLLWWRSGGQVHGLDVRMYLARRASLCWTCKPDAARMAIEHAVSLVATRHAPNAADVAKGLCMRKAGFLRLRGDAVRWLQRGIDRAGAAYNCAR